MPRGEGQHRWCPVKFTGKGGECDPQVWRSAYRCPISSLPRPPRLGSGSPAELWQQQSCAAPPSAASTLYLCNLSPPKCLRRQSPAQAARWGTLGGWWGLISQGGGGRAAKNRQNGKWLRGLKGWQRRDPSNGEGDSTGDPVAPSRDWERCLSLWGEGWGPLPMDLQGLPSSDAPAGQAPLLSAGHRRAKLCGCRGAAVPESVWFLGTQPWVTPALSLGTLRSASTR